jgi:bifunctional DNA-binding transcriptional regulator/antitoxin component of YhaV-PrlF toxin-antitoxin module
MGPVIIEVASVSDSGVMALPKRVREAIGMRGAGRVVFFVNAKAGRAVMVPEAACPIPGAGLLRGRGGGGPPPSGRPRSRPSDI